MSLTVRLKHEESVCGHRLRQFYEGSLVRVTENLPLAPAGVYRCRKKDNKLLCLNTGNYWFGVGEMYSEYLKPVDSALEVPLTDEQVCIAYANAAIERLY